MSQKNGEFTIYDKEAAKMLELTPADLEKFFFQNAKDLFFG